MFNCRFFRVLCALVLPMSAMAVEPIRWIDGTWDYTGAPKGKLLTGNPGWWGEQVDTGAVYTYEKAPTNPADKKMNLLLRGARKQHEFTRQESFGTPNGGEIVAVIDLKHRCVVTEVDVVAAHCRNSRAMAEFSLDGVEYPKSIEVNSFAAIKRLRMEEPVKARYVRLSFKGNNPKEPTYLQSVAVWGDSDEGELPVPYPPVDCGNAMRFSGVAGEGIGIYPMSVPHLDPKTMPKGEAPNEVRELMARNETETRYFAAVNRSGKQEEIAISAPDFGNGMSAELRIGAVFKVTMPPRALSDEEMRLLVVTNRYDTGAEKMEYDVLSFFDKASMPGKRHIRRYFANGGQLAGFPEKVELKAGEGCVLMLKMRTNMVEPGVRRGVLRAGSAKLTVQVDVVDLVLGEGLKWCAPWEPFTFQYPYETETRFDNDVRRFREIGGNMVFRMPEPGTKEAAFLREVPDGYVAAFFYDSFSWLRNSLADKISKGRFDGSDPKEVEEIRDAAHRVARRARELGWPLNRVIAVVADEPHRKNVDSVMLQSKIVKEAEPEFLIHNDPLMYRGKGLFEDSDFILSKLDGPYQKYTDVSNAIHPILMRPELRKLWFTDREINGTYNHPGGRFTHNLAYSLYLAGINGLAYYCYYFPHSRDVWDINTCNCQGFDYMPVLPLENDVALTPQYETLRETAETFRLLKAIEKAGRRDLIEKAAEEAKEAWDRTVYIYRYLDLSKPDALPIRNRLLGEFAEKAGK